VSGCPGASYAPATARRPVLWTALGRRAELGFGWAAAAYTRSGAGARAAATAQLAHR
jgi:hypothetical protein